MDADSDGLQNSNSDDSLKGNPAMPGGQLTSKPTCSKPYGDLDTSAFFCATQRPQLLKQMGLITPHAWVGGVSKHSMNLREA